mgnify:CR=1 FL=1
MDGEFPEIYRSKLMINPCGNRDQPSVSCITHYMFLLCVCKDALKRL